MIIKTSKILTIISGLLFIWYGLNWGKSDLFNELNVRALFKSGIKTEAAIMSNFKERKQLVPSIGEVHYYFPLGKYLYSGDGIDSISMKEVTEVIYLNENPYVNSINSKINIDQLLRNKVTDRYNYYFILFGTLLLFFGMYLFWK
jgi:hypothetical protein